MAGPVFNPMAVNGGGNFDPEECAYLRAVDRYRRKTGRNFLRATEFLEVARALGYRRVALPIDWCMGLIWD